MYNRYLRSDERVYPRIPMPDPPPDPPRNPGRTPPKPPPPESSPPRPDKDASQFFSRLLDQLPLRGVDPGDIEEKADDELLIALGLLLIL